MNLCEKLGHTLQPLRDSPLFFMRGRCCGFGKFPKKSRTVKTAEKKKKKKNVQVEPRGI